MTIALLPPLIRPSATFSLWEKVSAKDWRSSETDAGCYPWPGFRLYPLYPVHPGKIVALFLTFSVSLWRVFLS
ncbi:hypothetical protein FO488_04500 [Geobacter sp. FeAm09]|nr:hypothetical protein FO488_04500 [Geobacter sp. FeAm09]